MKKKKVYLRPIRIRALNHFAVKEEFSLEYIKNTRKYHSSAVYNSESKVENIKVPRVRHGQIN